MKEILIISAIGIGVYLVLYIFELCWNFVVISPVNIHLEELRRQSSLSEENAHLKESLLQLAEQPKMSAREARQRQAGEEKIEKLDGNAKAVLRCVLDHVNINYLHVGDEVHIVNAFALESAITRCVTNGLIQQNNHILSIAPEFLTAVESYFQS